jgi:3-methyladenine DNA glycosylase AlkD
VVETVRQVGALPRVDTPHVRALRRGLSRQLKGESPEFVLAVARRLLRDYGYRMIPYELIRAHHGAFRSLDGVTLEELGRGLDSWYTVDDFARTLAGPAWNEGLVDDRLIRRWAHSRDRWWRRAALVSTVALNVRSRGGRGDVRRTLDICEILADDRDEMVAKALSWALRELVVHDPVAVERFLKKHDQVLPALVRREVKNKLMTGLKNPARGRPSAEARQP